MGTSSIQAAVEVWAIDLSSERSLKDHRKLLSTDEQLRASKYIRKTDSYSYIVCRSALRGILAQYLGLRPENLRFRYTKNGKPELDSDELSIQFNVSHSSDRCLIAVTSGCMVGIDIEHIRDGPWERVSSRIFSTNELELLAQTERPLRNNLFFTLWTRKESLLKAIGTGVWRSAAEWDVTSDDARFVQVRGLDSAAQLPYNIRNIELCGDYRSAVTTSGDAREIVLKTW